jgi:hypothetical protein
MKKGKGKKGKKGKKEITHPKSIQKVKYFYFFTINQQQHH